MISTELSLDASSTTITSKLLLKREAKTASRHLAMVAALLRFGMMIEINKIGQQGPGRFSRHIHRIHPTAK